MSNDRDVVPIRTQVKQHKFTWSQYQNITKIPPLMVVYIPEKLTQRQESLMKRCQILLEHSVHHSLVRLIRHPDQIKTLSLEQTNAYFVIPEEDNTVIRRIKERFQNHGKIYLPRAVIGALCHYQARLPVRSLTISLSMHECHVFLSIGVKVASKEEETKKERERAEISKRILEMGGNVTIKWSSGDPINVVVTDSAANKHCIKAFKGNTPVVARNWVDETYECEKTHEYLEDESQYNALDHIDHFRVRPFYGLHFKIALSDPSLQKEAKNLIIENQGQIVYGDEDCLTHVVRQDRGIKVQQLNTYQTQGKKNLHFVGLNWLRKCAEQGRCIALKEFKSMTTQPIKQERVSPVYSLTEESFTPPFPPPLAPPEESNPQDNVENYPQSMLLPPPPPASLSRPQKEKTPYLSDDAILNSLFTEQPTVHASTQIRCLPDPELQIEQIYEPSQQLFWNDARKG